MQDVVARVAIGTVLAQTENTTVDGTIGNRGGCCCCYCCYLVLDSSILTTISRHPCNYSHNSFSDQPHLWRRDHKDKVVGEKSKVISFLSHRSFKFCWWTRQSLLYLCLLLSTTTTTTTTSSFDNSVTTVLISLAPT
jgi:hypothetical protein